MSQNNLIIKYTPVWCYSKDLFGDNQKILFAIIYILFIIILLLLSQLCCISPTACIGLLFVVLSRLVSIEYLYKDEYSIDENKNLLIIRHYPKKKSLNKTILYKDIKGLKICKYLWSKLVILDSSEGNIILYRGFKDLKKILDFFNSYYPDIETKGNFKAIEASIKRLYLECIIFIMLIFLLASSWISCTIYFLR